MAVNPLRPLQSSTPCTSRNVPTPMSPAHPRPLPDARQFARLRTELPWRLALGCACAVESHLSTTAPGAGPRCQQRAWPQRMCARPGQLAVPSQKVGVVQPADGSVRLGLALEFLVRAMEAAGGAEGGGGHAACSSRRRTRPHVSASVLLVLRARRWVRTTKAKPGLRSMSTTAYACSSRARSGRSTVRGRLPTYSRDMVAAAAVGTVAQRAQHTRQ